MKEIFKGFYSPSDEEIKKAWTDEQTLFIFDTNVLLYLYGYAKNTKNDFFQILEKISDNIWLPYHVGLEYQRNRLKIIKNEKYNFSKIEKSLNDIDLIFTKNIAELNLEQRHPELNEKTKILHNDISNLIKKYKKTLNSWNKKQPCVKSSDEIRKKINKLFENKISEKPESQDWLQKIYADGKQRYENKVPPGYEDKKEKEKQPNFVYSNLEYIPMYGDLIIWKQIIEKAKNEHIKSIIFVSDDVKEDWLYSVDLKGKKEIGARAELRDEIHKHADINLFTILTTSDFMKEGKVNLEIDINEDSINEVKINLENKRIKHNLNLNKEIVKKLKEINDYDINFKKNQRYNSLDKYIINESLSLSEWDRIYNHERIKNQNLLDNIKLLEEQEINNFNSFIKELESREKKRKQSEIEQILEKLKKFTDN
jgi:hypothetical protein